MDAGKTTKLLSEFPVHTYEEWKEAAVKLLKGRPFEKTLIGSPSAKISRKSFGRNWPMREKTRKSFSRGLMAT